MAMYKAVVAYDGQRYHGWQVQPDRLTVAGELVRSFEYVFKNTIHLVGASRTDAGVHALGQVVRIETALDIDSSRLVHAWRGRLAKDIALRSLFKCDASFHPQRNVKQKTYWYHIFDKHPLPFFNSYGFYYRRSFDVYKFKKALAIFIGKHDFRSFCTGEHDDTIRVIDSITLEYFRRFGMYRVTVKGERFLHFMIRRIVGAALQVATDSVLSHNDLLAILHAKDSNNSLFKAPAQGLMLAKIVYK